MVLRHVTPTVVADAGASCNCCAAPLLSACRDYEMADSPFLPTGKESDRTFRNVSSGLNPATELREFPMDVRPLTKPVHILPDFKDNLLSTGTVVNAGRGIRVDF